MINDQGANRPAVPLRLHHRVIFHFWSYLALPYFDEIAERDAMLQKRVDETISITVPGGQDWMGRKLSHPVAPYKRIEYMKLVTAVTMILPETRRKAGSTSAHPRSKFNNGPYWIERTPKPNVIAHRVGFEHIGNIFEMWGDDFTRPLHFR
jgi:hypothetical protein